MLQLASWDHLHWAWLTLTNLSKEMISCELIVLLIFKMMLLLKTCLCCFKGHFLLSYVLNYIWTLRKKQAKVCSQVRSLSVELTSFEVAFYGNMNNSYPICCKELFDLSQSEEIWINLSKIDEPVINLSRVKSKLDCCHLKTTLVS